MKNILNYFRQPKLSSACLAKERLQIVISNQRARQNGLDFLPQLQQDLIAVIAKYVNIDAEKINVGVDHRDGDLLELNIMLSDAAADSEMSEAVIPA